jgi:galactoside O-acetyltransferase
MAYLSPEQLAEVGFKKIGTNVRISTRAAIYNADQVELGDHARIDDFCLLSGKVILGRNVHIAVFCNLGGGSEGVLVDDFAGISYGSQVFSQSDDYTGRALTGPTVPLRFRAETKQAVHIGRHCIVGAHCVILPGITLAEGTAVGAMSLVTRSTTSWSIYRGIPARRVGERRRDMLELERQYLAEEAGLGPEGTSEPKACPPGSFTG